MADDVCVRHGQRFVEGECKKPGGNEESLIGLWFALCLSSALVSPYPWDKHRPGLPRTS